MEPILVIGALWHTKSGRRLVCLSTRFGVLYSEKSPNSDHFALVNLLLLAADRLLYLFSCSGFRPQRIPHCSFSLTHFFLTFLMLPPLFSGHTLGEIGRAGQGREFDSEMGAWNATCLWDIFRSLPPSSPICCLTSATFARRSSFLPSGKTQH